MNYHVFYKKMTLYPVFSVTEIGKQFPGFDRRRLVEWREKGYIQKLRNQYYCFSDLETGESFLFYAANKLYPPSYVSLESALSRYGVIPEGVFQTVSCSTLKTQTFDTPVGVLKYHHIKKKMYFGYRLESWGKHHYAIAEPEKALIDYLYLHPEIDGIDDLKSLRWNRLTVRESISMEKMESYASLIASGALMKRISLLEEYMNVKAE